MIGQVLDHYQIEAQLGVGGMGVVYKAYDVRLQRPVAIKLLARPTDDAARAILDEARAVSALNHPHICTIYEVGDSAEQAYIVMEYVEGRPLRELIPSDGLTVDATVAYAIQIADAVAHAHDHGVIHRDLKSSNIVITTEGRAKVLDFGLAIRFSPAQVNAATQAQTATEASNETAAGTLACMSPEVLRGKHADARSDIWTIGVILYEMLSGHLPFFGRSTAELCTEILRESPWPLPASIDAGLRGVVSRCLMKEPRQRYSRASDIRAALEAIQRELEGPTASRSQLHPLPGHSWWRHPSRTILGTAIALVAVVAIALGVPQTRRLLLPSSASPARGPVSGGPKAVAVFPFRAIGSEAEVDYIARGFTETLAARLVQSQVQVAAGDAVERAGKAKSVNEVARDLGVGLAVTGTVQQIAGKLRIIVNVEDVSDGRLVWAQDVSGERSELLAMEDRLHAGLVEALDVAPRSGERTPDVVPTSNFDAYDHYLKGRNALRAQPTAAGANAAIAFYQDALQRDPNFALAYAGMSEAMLRLYRDTREREWAERAQFAAEQARRIGPGQSEVHLAVGAIYNATGKASDAIAALKRALDLSPNNDKAYRELGLAYAAGGKGDEAMESLHKAVAINSYDWEHYNALGATAVNLGRYAESAWAFRKVIELEPDRVNGYSNLGAVHLYQGEFAMAAGALEKALKLRAHPMTYNNLGIVYANTDRIPEAVRMFEKAVELTPGEARFSNLADGYRWLGHRERASPLYEKAIALAYKRLQVNPRDADAMASLATYYAKKGDAAQAAPSISKAREIEPKNVTFIYYEAIIHQLAGRTPDALRALRDAFRAGYRTSFPLADPDFKALRSNRTFQALVKEFSTATP